MKELEVMRMKGSISMALRHKPGWSRVPGPMTQLNFINLPNPSGRAGPWVLLSL
jgi:hypothetical protein